MFARLGLATGSERRAVRPGLVFVAAGVVLVALDAVTLAGEMPRRPDAGVRTLGVGFLAAGLALWLAWLQSSAKPELRHCSALRRGLFLVPFYGYSALKGLAGDDARAQRSLMFRHVAWLCCFNANACVIGSLWHAPAEAIPLVALFGVGEAAVYWFTPRLFTGAVVRRPAPAAPVVAPVAAAAWAGPAVCSERNVEVTATAPLVRSVSRFGLGLPAAAAIVAVVGIATPGSHVGLSATLIAAIPVAVVVGVAWLLRRGRVGVGAAAAAAAGCGTATVIARFVTAHGSGPRDALGALVVVALITGRSLARYRTRCAAAGLPTRAPVHAARVPSLLWDERGVRALGRRPWRALASLLVGVPVAVVALYLSFINTAANSLPVVSDLIGDALSRLYRRGRRGAVGAVVAIAPLRGVPMLAVAATREPERVTLSVRPDPLRWGLLMGASASFQDFICEQLWLYGVPSTASGRPRSRGGRADEPAEARVAAAVIIVDPATPPDTVAAAVAAADRVICAFPPGPPAVARTAATAIGGVVPTAVAGLDDTALSRLRIAAAGPDGVLDLWSSATSDQWSYLAALDGAARALALA